MLIHFSAIQRGVSHFMRSHRRRLFNTILHCGIALTLVFTIISCRSTVRFSSRSTPTVTSSPSISLKSHANSPPLRTASNETLSEAQERLLTSAERWLGTPYRYGSTTRAGTDCSGFTMRVYEESGTGTLPRSTKDQFSIGAPVERESLRTGDLVFFNTNGVGVSHVGLYVGGDTIIHASSTYGVVRQSLSATYLAKAYIGARRVW
jgi:cell wall-associated NlpC family hydrolase